MNETRICTSPYPFTASRSSRSSRRRSRRRRTEKRQTPPPETARPTRARGGRRADAAGARRVRLLLKREQLGVEPLERPGRREDLVSRRAFHLPRHARARARDDTGHLSPRDARSARRRPTTFERRSTCPAARAARRPAAPRALALALVLVQTRDRGRVERVVLGADVVRAVVRAVVRRRLPAATRFAVCFVIGLAVRIGGSRSRRDAARRDRRRRRRVPLPLGDVVAAHSAHVQGGVRRRARARRGGGKPRSAVSRIAFSPPPPPPPPPPPDPRRSRSSVNASTASWTTREVPAGTSQDATTSPRGYPSWRGEKTRQDRDARAFYFFESKKRLRRADRGGDRIAVATRGARGR